MVETIADVLKEQIRIKQFNYGANLPISWKYRALIRKRASDKIFIDYLNAHEKYGAKIESESETIVDVIDEELISVYFIRDSLKMS